MGKSVHPDVLDGALGVVRNNATQMVALSGAPASYAAAVSGALASVAMAQSDFTLAAGQTSGRQAAVAAKPDVPVPASGTADPVALLDPVNSKLLYLTTCPAQAHSGRAAGW